MTFAFAVAEGFLPENEAVISKENTFIKNEQIQPDASLMGGIEEGGKGERGREERGRASKEVGKSEERVGECGESYASLNVATAKTRRKQIHI